MRRSLKTLVIKFILVGLIIGVPAAFSCIAMNLFPAYFLGGPYGRYKAQNDYALNDHSYNRVLITGDSLAQVSYMPSILSGGTYNFATGAETPVDGYYRLLDYLGSHDSPEYLFYSCNPTEFITQDNIWSAGVTIRGLSYARAREIMRDVRAVDGEAELVKDHSEAELTAFYLGVHPNVIKKSVKGLLHNILQGDCYGEYLEQYEWIVDHRGHWKHYQAGKTGSDINTEIVGESVRSFEVTYIADYYMRKILDLCRENGICLIMEPIPFNESTYDAVDPAFLASYKAYWDGLQREYPDMVINGEITCYDNEYFGDSVHCNSKGTEKFSKFIKDKYSYVFEEGTAG